MVPTPGSSKTPSLARLTTWLAARKIGALQARQDAWLREHREELDKEARKARKAADKKVRWRWALGCMLLNFGILAALKYLEPILSWGASLAESLTGQAATPPALNLLLPSFGQYGFHDQS